MTYDEYSSSRKSSIIEDYVVYSGIFDSEDVLDYVTRWLDADTLRMMFEDYVTDNDCWEDLYEYMEE